MRRPAPGFTLLEMMVALGIVAVLASLALPSFGSMVSRHRLKAAAEQMAVDLAELRMLAAQRGQALHLDVASGTQWCYALAVSAGCDCRVPQGCQLKTVRAADHPGVTMVEGQALRVEPQPGRPLSAAVLRSSDGALLRVGLSPLGRPKLCAPADGLPGVSAC